MNYLKSGRFPPSPKWQNGIPNRGVCRLPSCDKMPKWPARDLQGTRKEPATCHMTISQNLSVKPAPTLLQCQRLPSSFPCEKQKSCLYSDPSLRNAVKMAGLSQSVTLHSTGNISAEGSVQQEQSEPQQHMWNSLLFVIFPLKSTTAHSLHIQHLYVDWGYRFKTPIAKEAFR